MKETMNKNKILMISDHAMSPSGVGIQSRFLIEGLTKTGKYSFIQLGAALSHQNYKTIKINEDFYIKPIDGYGDANLLRSIILNEKPDALLIFTDARFFKWLFEIEDEIRQVCPILWWHVWDNLPIPDYNRWIYESVDTINCHSYLTYKMCKKLFPNKTNFIPHTFPKSVFYTLSKNDILKEKINILGNDRKDNFVCFWNNRNCKRKRPGDVLKSWKIFVEKLDKKNRNKVTLLMHTDPYDKSGLNLIEIAKHYEILDTVSFSTQKLSNDLINILHNISDVCLNISYNEGFGLSTLQSMMTSTPIIASKTGGLYRQVIDYRDNSENGIGLDIDLQTINGNQESHYIYEDYVSCDNVANALQKFYKFSNDKKNKLKLKVKEYSDQAFNYEKMINLWDMSLENSIKEFKCQTTNIQIVNLK
jgi:glycosyltransferase involved in cell wall biosynthesis